MEKTLISQFYKAVEENKKSCEEGQFSKANYALGCAVGLSVSLGIMGYEVTIDGNPDEICPRITHTKIALPKEAAPYKRPAAAAQDQPKQKARIPKDLLLPRAMAQFGESLKEVCPPNDCIVFRNVYGMYCERVADYERIMATCPDLGETTVRSLGQAIRADKMQLHDMWANNIAVNRRREAVRHDTEHRAKIAAQAQA